MVVKKKTVFNKLLKLTPIILLYISVLNEIDLNYIKYFSFNFPFILIYYWSLKKSESLGYGHIFIAGLINDAVIGFPIGFTSINYLLICGFAAYLRNITLRPRIIQDWLFFLLTLFVVNSLSFTVLILLFTIKIEYNFLFYNTFFTFLLYLIFAKIFDIYHKIVFRETND